jgi:hypothetical protein
VAPSPQPSHYALFVLKALGKCADKNVDVKILSRHHLSHRASFSEAAFAGGLPQIVARKDLPCRIAVSLPQVPS